MTRTPLGTQYGAAGTTSLTFPNVSVRAGEMVLLLLGVRWSAFGSVVKVQVVWGSMSVQATLRQDGVDPATAMITVPGNAFLAPFDVGTHDLTLTQTSGPSLDHFGAILSKYQTVANPPDDYDEYTTGDNFIVSSTSVGPPSVGMNVASTQAKDVIIGCILDSATTADADQFWILGANAGPQVAIQLTMGQTIKHDGFRLWEGYREVSAIAQYKIDSGLATPVYNWTASIGAYKLAAALGGYTSYQYWDDQVIEGAGAPLPEVMKKIAQGDLRFVPPR